MHPKAFLGLIKFFRNEDHLNQLIGGKLHCNTPEYYRLHNEKSISDPHESCSWSYRQERGDTPPTVLVDGVPLKGLTGVTVRATGMKGRWLHCWTWL